MFLFQISVTDVICYMKCKEFYLRSDFGNNFSLYLQHLNQDKIKTHQNKDKIKIKTNTTTTKPMRNEKKKQQYFEEKTEIISSIDQLIHDMHVFPLNLTIFIKKCKIIHTGSIQIPWKETFFNFLQNISIMGEPKEITDEGEYHLYHDVTFKRLATIYLNIKLSYLYGINDQKHSEYLENMSESNVSTYITKQNMINPGIITTRYRGRKLEEYMNKKITNIPPKQLEVKQEYAENENENRCKSNVNLKTSLQNLFLDSGDRNFFSKQVYCLGYCTIENKFENESKKSSSAKLSKKSGSSVASSDDNQLANYKVRLCNSECTISPTVSCAQSNCKLDLPKEIQSLIKVTKCDEISCSNRIFREPPTVVDSKILISLKGSKNICCQNIAENMAKSDTNIISNSMKIKSENNPCYCACECKFGFSKNTTYCTVCGGYEVKGEDFSGRLLHELPHPCPLYHKLMDRYKSRSLILSGSGSGSRRTMKLSANKSSIRKSISKDLNIKKENFDAQEDDKTVKKGSIKKYHEKESDRRSTLSEMESKAGNKNNNDAKFKFNYGYQGIRTYCFICLLYLYIFFIFMIGRYIKYRVNINNELN